MNTQEIVKRFEEITALYLEELDRFSMEQLLHKPNAEDWSIGQLYVHLVGSARHMQLRNVELCRDASHPAVQADGSKSEAGGAIFAQGAFPPIRIHVPPSPEYTPGQPDSKEGLAEDLRSVAARMRELEPLLAGIPSCHTVAHPRLGYLNATEWFELAEMHYRHHLRQLERLKALLD